jgi:HK97 family phage major capsid protein
MSQKIRIRAMQANQVEIEIDGVIGYWDDGDAVDADYFIDALNWYAAMGTPLLICINSIGGSYIQGLRIAEAIKSYPHAITTRVEDRAYSIASLIAMSGKRREIAANASGIMIHKPWAEDVSGTAEQLREVADMLDEITAIFADDYLRLTGVDVKAYLDGTDHHFAPQDCLDQGFVDAIVTDPEIIRGELAPPPARTRPVEQIAASLRACIQARHNLNHTIAADPKPGEVRTKQTPPEPAITRSTTMADPATTAPAPAAPVDVQAIQAKALADIQARNRDLIDTGKAYAKFGGEALAMQAVAEGWEKDQLNAALMKAMAAGPAHATYGAGARAQDNLDAQTNGFKHFGEFAHHVRNAALGNGRVDERLVRAAATSYANEGSGGDGGFAVPPQFAQAIAALAMEEDSLLAMTDSTPVTGNSMSFPKDETTPWGSTGVIANWEGEGDTNTERKPVLSLDHLRLKKLVCMVKATDELLADTQAMAAYLRNKMGQAVRWKSNDAIINGTGVGQPLGILRGGSVVEVAKETSQAADSIVAANIAKMYARVFKAGGPVVWLHNPDAFPQIITLSLNSNPIWVPNNQGFQGAPNGFLLGRPLIETDACDTVGDVGDLILANMGGYRSITKAGGESFSESMHLHFDQDIVAYKLVFRMDGQPSLSAAVTPPNSAATRSHFATLAARA